MNNLESTLLRAMLNKEPWKTLRGTATPDTFDSHEAKSLLKVIERMHGDAQGDLDLTAVKLDIEVTYKNKPDFCANLLAAFKEVSGAEVLEGDPLRRVLKRAIVRDRAYKAAEYISNHIHDETIDLSPAVTFLDEASNASVIMDADVLDYSSAQSPADPTRYGVVGLGVSSQLDEWLEGGTANGELFIYVAPAGVGKTSFLWHSLTHAARKGRNCLGVTLEINSRKCIQRVDQALTGFSKEQLISRPKFALDRREELGGKIWIKDWCAKQPSVDDIRALILQMRQNGQEVDYLMVDYMELVRPDFFNARQPRMNYSRVAKALRSLAAELDIPVITAWQTNRAAADKHVLSKTDVGEDWGVIKIADTAVGLNQSSEELKDKVMRVNILKQRESTNRNLVNLRCDLDRMIIEEHTYEEETKLEVVV